MSTADDVPWWQVCRRCLLPISSRGAVTRLRDSKQREEVLKNSDNIKVTSFGAKSTEAFNEKGRKTAADEKLDPLMCAECNAGLKKQNEVSEKIRQYEGAYFEPRRNKNFGFHMNFEFGFKVCRMCLTPETVAELSSAFDDGAKLVQMIKLVADVDIFKDHQKHDCLMCKQCSRDLEDAFTYKYKMRPAGTSNSSSINNQAKLNNATAAVKSSRRNQKISKFFIKLPKKQEVKEKGEKLRKPEGKTSGQSKCNKNQQSKKFKCQICGKVANTKGDLKRHVDAVHSKMKKFECDLCGRKVYLKHEMKLHLKHGHINAILKLTPFYDESRPFRCKIKGCTRYFKTKQHLNQHLDVHSDERPFNCSFKDCSKRFKTKYKLDQHVIDHSNIRPFKCFCGQAFKRSGQLKTHKKNIHSKK